MRLNKRLKIKKTLTRHQLLKMGSKVLRRKYFATRRGIKAVPFKNILIGLRGYIKPTLLKSKKTTIVNQPKAKKLAAEEGMLYSFCNRMARNTNSALNKNLIVLYAQAYLAQISADGQAITPAPKTSTEATVVENPNKVEKVRTRSHSKNWIPEEVWKKMSGSEKHEFLLKTGKLKSKVKHVK